jgi:DNA-binding winged helix-turn-helix (wHTH) protein
LDILFLLVERRGQLVSRDDIIAKVWGKDVFLDTDSSINGAIRKIRLALKDDPENPVFIQTVTGKGYRFIAVVAEAEIPARESGGKIPESSKVVSEAKGFWRQILREEEGHRSRNRRIWCAASLCPAR